MTYEDYRRELLAALDKADWRNLRDKDGPAYQVLVRASWDRKNLTLDQWQALSNLYYERTKP